MQILIANQQKTVKLNIKKIKALIRRILRILRVSSKSSLSITFLSRARIKGLNRRYFKRDRPTDVVAFGYKQAPTPTPTQKWTGSKREGRVINGRLPLSAYQNSIYQGYLGDIVICPSLALENSKLYHNSFLKELALYVIHGILHLLGYVDTTKAKRLKMQKKEEFVTKALFEHGPSCSNNAFKER